MKIFTLVLAAAVVFSFTAGVANACNKQTKVGRDAVTAFQKPVQSVVRTSNLQNGQTAQ